MAHIINIWLNITCKFATFSLFLSKHNWLNGKHVCFFSLLPWCWPPTEMRFSMGGFGHFWAIALLEWAKILLRCIYLLDIPLCIWHRRSSITTINFKRFTINVKIIVLELLQCGQFKKNCSKLKTELWLMEIALPPESIHQEHQKWNCYWFSDHFGYHCNLWFQHKKRLYLP